jgi:hypothetical protein
MGLEFSKPNISGLVQAVPARTSGLSMLVVFHRTNC